jgi:hydroxyacylglutathione hydrolase
MILDRISAGIYATNCYVIGCSQSGQGVVVDPGADSAGILKMVEKHRLKIKYIILTHGHFDHIGALATVKKATGAQVAIHREDSEMLVNPDRSLASYVSAEDKDIVEPDLLLEGGEVLEVGALKLEIIHTPGHTLGGISIKIGNDVLLSGDTLFAGSIGRTDLPGGDYDTIIDSINTKLISLDDGMRVYPGHGPATTIGKEKVSNPFV